MSDENRRSLVTARPRNQLIEAISKGGGTFDVDFLHVMEDRDDELIKNEILYGAGSPKFVYDFQLGGSNVSGISVIGARHLAAHYGGLQHRIVASVQKTGSLFTFNSYPSAGQAMHVDAKRIPELEEEPDYYEALVEVSDIKTGNSIQVQRRELKMEKKRDGSYYERPHYATIAQSKAYRNAVLNLLPQDVTLKWKENMLKLGKNETVTESVLDQKRAAVIQFAAAKSITLQREQVNDLTMEQIAGLADAAREGKVPAFAQAAQALGLTQVALTHESAPAPQQQRQPAGPAAPAPEAPPSPNPEPQAGRPAGRRKKDQPADGAPQSPAADPAPQQQAPVAEPTPAPKPAEMPAPEPKAAPAAAGPKKLF